MATAERVRVADPGDPGETVDRRVAWGCRAAVVLAIVGVFGAWRTVGPVTLNGFQGPHNGWLVIIFGLISLAGAGAATRGSWPGIVLVIGCAAVMASAGIRNIVDDGAVLGGGSGWGVWLTVVSSVALLGAALAAAVRRLRGGSRESTAVARPVG